MGYGVDEKGERMSKSKGNVIDPLPLLESYGADTFRFWSAAEASLGSDFRCSEEKIKGTGKFLTKLWNLARFVSSFPVPKSTELCAADRWILAEADAMLNRCLIGYADYNFFIVANEVRDFIWNLFAPHYVEMVKARAYNLDGQFRRSHQEAAWFTLNKCLRIVLLLLAPICPFITDHIWRRLYSKSSIHDEQFPKSRRRLKNMAKLTGAITEFNSSIWKFKKDRKLALNSRLEAVYAPVEVQRMKNDLQSMHNIEAVTFGKPPRSAGGRAVAEGNAYIIQ
jgi:valyl-tRNA synthetase